MPRIKPDRIGYEGPNGCKCVGIDIPVIEPLDCDINKYKKLPMAFYGGMTDVPWEALDNIEISQRFMAIRQMCNLDYDPFFGFFMNMYQAFVDEGMDYILSDDCYESNDIYWPGFLNPYPRMKFVGADCGSKEEDGDEEEEESS